MSKKDAPVILIHDLESHPALLAWREVSADKRRPASIEILAPENKEEKPALYRLHGVGPRGEALIAKRARRGHLDFEHRMYVEIFPAVSLPTLRQFGFIEHLEGYSWLFLEDAGDVWYSPEIPKHRALATEWLALLHLSSATCAPWLPRMGPAFHLNVLHAARDGLRESRGHPALTGADVRTFEAILQDLDRVEDCWPAIAAACAGMPETLVHGDFSPQNVRVRHRRQGPALVAFDWEHAGWAPPACDLGLLPNDKQLLFTYHRHVHETWPWLQRSDIERVWNVGELFRLLNCIHWERRSFDYDWIDSAMRNIVWYQRHLRRVLEGAEWLCV